MRIVVDSREARPLFFRVSKNMTGSEIKKLDVGDYSIEGFEDKIAIERKSAVDLFGTLGKGHKRFEKELERAKSLDYFAIVVESPFNVVYNKDFDGAHHITMRGDLIIKIVMTLAVKHGIHIWFCNGRNETVSIIRQIFNAYMRWQVEKENEYRRLARRAKKEARAKSP